jgi:serine/threonine protein kinase
MNAPAKNLPPQHLPAGAKLDDRFEVVEFLGAGAFGAVYHARQLMFGRPIRDVAVKLFSVEVTDTGNISEMFRDALTLIELMDNSQCPPHVSRHLVPVYDVGVLTVEGQRRAFMSMKLIRGKRTLENSVKQWRSAGGMPVATSLALIRQLLVPLAWMHAQESAAYHGDLKPDNVLVMDDNIGIVLTDFGLSGRAMNRGGGGAIAYQAPEVLLNPMAGPIADMYGVGLIWYELLTGKMPFKDVGLQEQADDNIPAYVRANFDARKWPIRALLPADPDDLPRIPPPSEINEELGKHPRVEEMVKRCLAYRQSDRYPNARQLMEDIDKYVAGDPSLAIPSAVPEPDVSPVAHLPESKTPQTILADAKTLWETGRASQAIALIEGLLKTDPASIGALSALARAQAAGNDYDTALTTCEKIRVKCPDDPAGLDLLADIVEARGEPGMARILRSQAENLRQSQKSRSNRRT